MEVLIIIGIGVFNILLGLAAKKCPDLIAGYNTMSSEKKKEVDVEKLSSIVRNMLFTIGLIYIVGAIIIAIIGHTETIIKIAVTLNLVIMISVCLFYPTPKKLKKE